MRPANRKALAEGAAQRFGGELHGHKLTSEHSTEDLFRIANRRAHVIGCYRRGPDRTRAILRCLRALKAALAKGARP